MWAAGSLGDGRLLAVGPCQQSVETVVSAGVVPLVVTVVDEAGGGERGLVDEERAVGGVLSGLTRCRFLRMTATRNLELIYFFFFKSIQIRNLK